MKIVVGYDKTDESRAALDWAIEGAKPNETEIIVVTSMRGGGSSGSDAQLDDVRFYRREMEKVEQRLTAAGIPHEVKTYVRGQSFAEDVIQAASDEAADMIVIGHPHTSPVGKLVGGAKARAILLGAECPVLLVKPKAITITKTIDIELPAEETQTAWNSYVTRTIVGSGNRLSTSELLGHLRQAEAGDGTVQFTIEGPRATRMAVALQHDSEADAPELPKRIKELHKELDTELRRFKEYAEGSEW